MTRPPTHRAPSWLRRVLPVAIAAGGLALAGCDAAAAPNQAESAVETRAPDPMLPTSSPDDALVSPLALITVVTGDLEATRRFYQGAMDLVPHEVTLDAADRAAFADHYGLAESATGRMVTFSRQGLDDAIKVRAVEISPEAPESRTAHNGRHEGPLGLGFAARNLGAREAVVQAFGFDSVKSVVEMDFPRADGTTYTVGEIHFRAPDSVLVLGVDRGPLTPVGKIDAALDIGGPSYASMLMSDADAVTPFFADVLGFERRREMSFTASGPDGGMGLDAGANVLFQQWFSPGATSGYLVMMEITTGGLDAPAPFDMTTRGVSMWSFQAKDLDAVLARAAERQTPILSPTRSIVIDNIGPVRSVVFATADGFPVEVFEPIDPARE